VDDVKGEKMGREEKVEEEEDKKNIGRKTGVYSVQKKSCAGDYSVQLRGAPLVETMKVELKKVGLVSLGTLACYRHQVLFSLLVQVGSSMEYSVPSTQIHAVAICTLVLLGAGIRSTQ